MRLYTLEEARAVLPDIIPIVTRIRTAYLRLKALQAATAGAGRVAETDGSLAADPWAEDDGQNHIERLNRSLRGDVGRLERRGIELKDPEMGLIDFYAERDGRVVYLCFKLGEDDIQHWHTLESGYAGRQPL